MDILQGLARFGVQEFRFDTSSEYIAEENIGKPALPANPHRGRFRNCCPTQDCRAEPRRRRRAGKSDEGHLRSGQDMQPDIDRFRDSGR